MNPIVLVTGGSRGIGAAVCRLAAARGYDVAVNYQSRKDAADAVVTDCRSVGVRAEAFAGDMGHEADIVALFAEVDRRLGRISHFVNNAGIVGQASRLDAAASETIRACVDINVTGALLAAREAIKRISTRHGGPGGTIVNLSSAASTLGAPGEFVWYAATKGAIDAMTYGLSKELGGDGIRVNAVAPGLIDTEIHASAGRAERVAEFSPLVPLGRAGSAEEVAETILFLMSDASSYVSGAILRVGGGR